MKVQIQVTHNGRVFSGEMELAPAQPHKLATGGAKRETPRAEVPTKPGEIIEHLYHKNFFKGARSLSDTAGELGQKGYNFNKPSILMALKAAEYLQRRGKKGSYTFIQKHPPSI